MLTLSLKNLMGKKHISEANPSIFIVNKTSRLICAIHEMFGSVCHQGHDISIGETTLAFRGRCRLKVYGPSKLDECGLQLMSMCDVSPVIRNRLNFVI